MRTTMLGVAALCVFLAGCVSVTPQPSSTASPTPPPFTTLPPLPAVSGSPSPTQAGRTLLPSIPFPTPPPVATPTADAGSQKVVVSFDSGPNAGIYYATGDPACDYGIQGDDVWGAQYGNFGAGDGQLSTVQITDEPDSTGSGKQRIVSGFIVVGPVFGGTSYTLSLDRFSGPFTREVQDNGQSAVIHIAGKSIETPLGPGGVLIDVVVTCPVVNRG